MRTLADALASISEHSAAIHSAAQHNAAPAGRYTTAFLDSIHANPDPVHAKLRAARRRAGAPENNGVLDLIRDALPAEDRLFKYVGESDGGAKKTYQEREGVVTPLREQRVKERKQGGEDAEVLLETAIRLVDDYHDMPRARARIHELIDINNAQLERIFELEVTIEDASRKASSTSVPTPSAPTPAKAKTARTRKIPENADEALLLEEQALRALEKRLAPIRAARPPPAQASAADAPPPSRGGLANSPPIRAGQSSSRANIASTPPKSPVNNPLARSSRTPSASLAHSRPAKTPSKTPQTSSVNITNALVSQTPRTARPTIDRFSPLRLLGTPRAYRPDASRSGLRESFVPQAEDGEKRAGLSLFSSRLGRGVLGASTSRTAAEGNAGAERSLEAEDAGVFDAPGSGTATTAEHDTIPSTGADAQLDTDDTVRIPQHESAEDQDVGDETIRLDAGPAQEGLEPPSDNPPAFAAMEAEAPGMLNGVFVDHPMMAAAAGKIIGTRLAEIRQGLAPSEVLNTDMRSLVDHLTRLLRSDPDPPPSPSSASSSSHLSATTPEKAMPITQQGILAAQILLTLLRLLPAGTPAAETPELGMSMAELKEVVADLIQARGWEQEQSVALDRGTKLVYWIMTKKVVRIDRTQCKGAGGKVILAI